MRWERFGIRLCFAFKVCVLAHVMGWLTLGFVPPFTETLDISLSQQLRTLG